MSTANATGPRTAAGKAASSRNATRHGLLSAATVLGTYESTAEWEAFSAQTVETLAPIGLLELAIAKRVAHLHWRLARLARYEAEAIDAVLPHPDQRPTDQSGAMDFEAAFWERGRQATRVGRMFAAQRTTPFLSPSLPAAPTVELIMRYEAHLSRELTRTLHQLDHIQALRAARSVAEGDALPPPIPGGTVPGSARAAAGNRPEIAQDCETNSPSPQTAQAPATPHPPTTPPATVSSIARLLPGAGALMSPNVPAGAVPESAHPRPGNLPALVQNCETNVPSPLCVQAAQHRPAKSSRARFNRPQPPALPFGRSRRLVTQTRAVAP